MLIKIFIILLLIFLLGFWFGDEWISTVAKNKHTSKNTEIVALYENRECHDSWNSRFKLFDKWLRILVRIKIKGKQEFRTFKLSDQLAYQTSKMWRSSFYLATKYQAEKLQTFQSRGSWFAESYHIQSYSRSYPQSYLQSYHI